MKDVYVIKVKTKPPLSSLYPSERRYSASTVGGLSLVHLGLSILAFLLGALARSLQGPVLSFGCMVPFVSGLLAWRRWYMDRNISLFFYGSLFSLVVSVLCGVATAFDVASVNETRIIGPTWKLEGMFSYPERFVNDQRLLGIIEQNDTDEAHLVKTLDDRSRLDDRCNDSLSGNLPSAEEDQDHRSPGSANCSTKTESSPPVRYLNKLFSFWRGDQAAETRTNLILDVNLLVTCVLEMCWSLLSVKISLCGMRNRSADASCDNIIAGPAQAQRVKPRAPNPGLEQFHSRDDIYGGNLQSFSGYRRNSVTDHSGPRLPLPESNKEFRERVERFLANQAAHRIVEGSCS